MFIQLCSLLEGMLIVSCFIPFWEQLWLAALRTSHGCWPLVENLVADLPRFWLDSLCCIEIDLFQLVFFFFATCVRISAMKYHWDYKQMMTMKSPICFGRCSGSHFPTTIDNQTSTIKTQWSEEWLQPQRRLTATRLKLGCKEDHPMEATDLELVMQDLLKL